MTRLEFGLLWIAATVLLLTLAACAPIIIVEVMR